MTKELNLTDKELEEIVEQYDDVLFRKIVDKAVEHRINMYDNLEEMYLGKGLYFTDMYKETLRRIVDNIISPNGLAKYVTDKEKIRQLIQERIKDK